MYYDIILVTNFYDSYSGSITDFIDLYLNLYTSGLLCKLYIHVEKKDFLLFYKIINNYYTFNMSKFIIKSVIFNLDFLYDMNYKCIIVKYNILYHKLIKIEDIHDVYTIISWNFVDDLMNNNNFIISNKNLVGVLSTITYKNELKDKYIGYFIKFNEYRLNNMIVKYNGNTYDYSMLNYEKDKKELKFNIHNYSKLIYSRRYLSYSNSTNIPICIEMKGKTIFEFLYFNKEVYYKNTKCYNDGLTDYLNMFNINDNISQDLNISKEEIYDKLVKFDIKELKIDKF